MLFLRFAYVLRVVHLELLFQTSAPAAHGGILLYEQRNRLLYPSHRIQIFRIIFISICLTKLITKILVWKHRFARIALINFIVAVLILQCKRRAIIFDRSCTAHDLIMRVKKHCIYVLFMILFMYFAYTPLTTGQVDTLSITTMFWKPNRLPW